MNKRQKEVIQLSLEDEKAILEALEKNYTKALADIKRNIRELQSNPLTQSKAYQLEFQRQLEMQLTGILDNLQGKNFTSIADYLNTCYNNGFIGTMYDLQGQGVPLVLPIDQNQVLKAVMKTGDDIKLANKLGVSTNELKKQVLAELQRGFSTSLSYADIARNISNYGQTNMGRAKTIARTEGHRVQNEAKMDALHKAKSKGADVVKQWDSTLDSLTRETHQQLDGQIRELDEPFEVGGKKAMSPGAFGDPSEDCNCRCAMLQRARWAVERVDEETGEVTFGDTTYQKWNNETGGLIECSGYSDFKEKYLKTAEHLQKSQNSGKIKGQPFKPASTIAEAEQYARRFAPQTSFAGVTDVEAVNVVNQTLTNLTAEYPIDTLSTLSTNGRLKNANARANGGLLEIRTSYLNNPGQPTDWQARIADYPTRISNYQAMIDSGNWSPHHVKQLKKAIKDMEDEMKFARWSVSSASSDKIASTITHEYGHILADQLFGQINGGHFCSDYAGTASIRKMVEDTFAEARRTGDIYGISMYANTNSHEFFAECFAAHCNGEKLPDYIVKMLKGALGK